MRFSEIDKRILSYPLRVEWRGFETDTFRLQERGWSISAEQDVYAGGLRLAMRHEQQQMRAITTFVRWDPFADMGDLHELRSRCFQVIHMANRIPVMMHDDGIRWDHFQPIDARPQMSTSKVTDFEDLVHFAPALVRTNEIILPEATVPDLMKRILELQEPGRQEFYKRQLAEERQGMHVDAVPRQKFHAQILSIAA